MLDFSANKPKFRLMDARESSLRSSSNKSELNVKAVIKAGNFFACILFINWWLLCELGTWLLAFASLTITISCWTCPRHLIHNIFRSINYLSQIDVNFFFDITLLAAIKVSRQEEAVMTKFMRDVQLVIVCVLDGTFKTTSFRRNILIHRSYVIH